MCSHPEGDFPYFGEVTPLLEEALLIPFYINGEAVGTIWVVAHDASRRFDMEDLRVMTSLGKFAAAAYQTVLNVNAMQRVAAIVESSNDAIISRDLEGVITSDDVFRRDRYQTTIYPAPNHAAAIDLSARLPPSLILEPPAFHLHA